MVVPWQFGGGIEDIEDDDLNCLFSVPYRKKKTLVIVNGCDKLYQENAIEYYIKTFYRHKIYDYHYNPCRFFYDRCLLSIISHFALMSCHPIHR